MVALFCNHSIRQTTGRTAAINLPFLFQVMMHSPNVMRRQKTTKGRTMLHVPFILFVYALSSQKANPHPHTPYPVISSRGTGRCEHPRPGQSNNAPRADILQGDMIDHDMYFFQTGYGHVRRGGVGGEQLEKERISIHRITGQGVRKGRRVIAPG